MALLKIAVDQGNKLENNEPKIKMPKLHGKLPQKGQQILTKDKAKIIAQKALGTGITVYNCNYVPQIYGINPKTNYIFIIHDNYQLELFSPNYVAAVKVNSQIKLFSTKYIAVDKVTGDIQYGHDNSEG